MLENGKASRCQSFVCFTAPTFIVRVGYPRLPPWGMRPVWYVQGVATSLSRPPPTGLAAGIMTRPRRGPKKKTATLPTCCVPVRVLLHLLSKVSSGNNFATNVSFTNHLPSMEILCISGYVECEIRFSVAGLIPVHVCQRMQILALQPGSCQATEA